MGEFGWAYVAGGAITGALGPTGSVLLKTGQNEISGSGRLLFNTSSYALQLSGSIYVSGALTASNLYLPNLNAATAVSSKYLALDSDNNLVLTSSNGSGGGGGSITVNQAGGGSVGSVTTLVFTSSTVTDDGGGQVTIMPVIGASEDGSYANGLFTDFGYSTPIGTAIDRFNEVLKGVAPSAAPALDDTNCDDSGTAAKLSFGSSQSISGYTNAQPSTLSPTDNLSDININGTFTSTTSNNDVRVACFDGTTVINGTLNADVSADSPNYTQYAFGDGDQGTLKLFVNNNSTEIHSVDLSSFGNGSSLNGDGSGFTLSATSSGHFSDGSAFDTFKHRTGSYIITAASQRNGWNYARITHVVGATTNTTNYIEWVNDPDSNALSSDTAAMDSLSMTGTKTLSGVYYNTGGSAEYRVRVLNAYRNIYSTSNITFSTTNCSISSQTFPIIDYSNGETETKVLNITGAVTITGDPILNGSITAGINVPAPLKSNLSNASSQSISGILLYNLSDNSTVTSETFRGESYRQISGSYASQSDVTSNSNDWNSATSLATVDGLMFYNSRLYAPVQGGVSGDFRNTSQGGSIANGPTNNVNYSSITSGTRTFFRSFQNNSGGSQTNFDITIQGSGTIVSLGTSLSTSNIHVLIKLPNTSNNFTTGWMDLAVAFATGQTSDGSGCLNGSFDSSLNATNSATFGVESVGNNEYIMVKIEADASWTGYISALSVSWG